MARGWKRLYQKKLTGFEHIFDRVSNGMALAIPHAAGEPQRLTAELKNQIKRFKNLSVYSQISYSSSLINEPGSEKHLSYRVSFIGPELRKMISRGQATCLPSHNFFAAKNILSGRWPVDVALIQVSPPNSKGYVSLNVSVDYIIPAIKKAKYVLAQVNKYAPYTFGEGEIPLSKITSFIEHDEPLIEYSLPKPGPAEKRIGKFIASLVPDGATLQMGIGMIPDATLLELGTKKNLGIHTEMFSDSVIPLIKKGVINGRVKKIDKGKIVASFLMGTKKLYDFVDKNRMILMKTLIYTNDPFIIAKNDRVISINSALEVDFSGQVAAESIGPYEYSGTGGQVDFVRGALRSKEGKAIIAFPSTAKGGKISRIVPQLTPGAIVTTTRDDIDYVITEYGIAELRGKSIGQRARSLIKIAHPKFRSKLEKEIKGKNKWSFIYQPQ